MASRDSSSRRVVEHFTEFAPSYSEQAFRSSRGLAWISSTEIQAVLTALGDMAGAAILDAGVGTGRIAQLVVSAGANVIGVDLTRAMLERCRAAIAEDVPLIQAEVGPALPFRGEAFDAVVCLRVIKYVSAWTTALAELCRLLRRGGIMILEIPNARSLARWGYRGLPVSFATYREAEAMLRDTGFSIEATVPGTRLPFVLYQRATTNRRLAAVRWGEAALAFLLRDRSFVRSFVIVARKV